jgi:uncharacterized membrane protein
MSCAKVDVSFGLAWLRCGWQRVRAQPALWLGMSLIYLALGFALRLIPLAGNLLLILVSPLFLAGALLAARDEAAASAGLPPPASAPRTEKLRFALHAWLANPARRLFQAFGNPHKMFALISVCIVTLGLTMIVGIAEYALTGGSIISGLAGAKLTGPLKLTLLAGIVIVALLYVLLAMALFYLVPLTLFRGVEPMLAVGESFQACRANALPLLVFAGVFLLPTLAILYFLAIEPVIGYPLAFAGAFLLLPTFVAGGYCSFETLFLAPSAQVVRT